MHGAVPLGGHTSPGEAMVSAAKATPNCKASCRVWLDGALSLPAAGRVARRAAPHAAAASIRCPVVPSGLDSRTSPGLVPLEFRKASYMEIYLDRRAVRQIRLSAQEAIEEDDTDSLREDVLEAFSEEQVEEIERRLDNGDFYEFLTDVLDEWSGDDVDELLELLETQLGEVGIDLKTDVKTEEGEEAEDGETAESGDLEDLDEDYGDDDEDDDDDEEEEETKDEA
jgi:hypothetical protein